MEVAFQNLGSVLCISCVISRLRLADVRCRQKNDWLLFASERNAWSPGW